MYACVYVYVCVRVYACVYVCKGLREKLRIKEIIKVDMEEAGQEDVFRKIKNDFKKASVSIEDLEIREEIEKANQRAKEDFK